MVGLGRIVTTVTLVGAGVLIGVFWDEWRSVQLGELLPDSLSDSPASVATGEQAAEAADGGRWQNVGGLDRAKVEILNGSGTPGLARKVSDHLQEVGFDVVSVANADHFEHGITHVLDRSGRDGAAHEVARGLSADSVVVALDPDLFLDVTVVVGQDWVEQGRD